MTSLAARSSTVPAAQRSTTCPPLRSAHACTHTQVHILGLSVPLTHTHRYLCPETEKLYDKAKDTGVKKVIDLGQGKEGGGCHDIGFFHMVSVCVCVCVCHSGVSFV